MRKIFILLFFLISAPSFSQDVKDIWKQLGSDINGETADDESGSFVSFNGDGSIVAIGAQQNDGNGDLPQGQPLLAGSERGEGWPGAAALE